MAVLKVLKGLSEYLRGLSRALAQRTPWPVSEYLRAWVLKDLWACVEGVSKGPGYLRACVCVEGVSKGPVEGVSTTHTVACVEVSVLVSWPVEGPALFALLKHPAHDVMQVTQT